ncbi:MAG TPA: BsuPI-related putative proteinase inhibitor [Longimicrobium sp.]|jgi:hypothetical protein
MRRSLRTPLLALLVALASCRPAAEVAAPAPARHTGPLAASIQVDAAPDSVRFVLQVINSSNAPVRLTFASGMTHDFVVRDGGREVWRWSRDRSFVQSMVSISLGAGETRSYDAVWRPAAALRGRRLTVEGRLTSTNHPIGVSSPLALP